MAFRKRTVLIVVVSTIGSVVAAAWVLNWRFESLAEARELAMEGNPTTEQLMSLLNYSDRIVLNNTLTRLERSKSDAGRERAAELLHHPDLYVWYCSSMYLGAIEDQRSIPYLIRGLDHPAWRSRPTALGYLTNLTGKDFGEDKSAWTLWWISQHPDAVFDFETKKP